MHQKAYKTINETVHATTAHPNSARLTKSPRRAMKDIIFPSISSPSPLQKAEKSGSTEIARKTQDRIDMFKWRVDLLWHSYPSGVRAWSPFGPQSVVIPIIDNPPLYPLLLFVMVLERKGKAA